MSVISASLGLVVDSNREPANELVVIYQNMSPTRRSGKALKSRSGGNMPQHDGDALDYMRSDADEGCYVSSTTALRCLKYATRWSTYELGWLNTLHLDFYRNFPDGVECGTFQSQ